MGTDKVDQFGCWRWSVRSGGCRRRHQRSGRSVFYRKQNGPQSRILILDNHDDFGGHAKRNEFRYGDRLYLVNGGTLNVEAPSQYSTVAAACSGAGH